MADELRASLEITSTVDEASLRAAKAKVERTFDDVGANVRVNRAGKAYDPSTGRWLKSGTVGSPRNNFAVDALINGNAGAADRNTANLPVTPDEWRNYKPNDSAMRAALLAQRREQELLSRGWEAELSKMNAAPAAEEARQQKAAAAIVAGYERDQKVREREAAKAAKAAQALAKKNAQELTKAEAQAATEAQRRMSGVAGVVNKVVAPTGAVSGLNSVAMALGGVGIAAMGVSAGIGAVVGLGRAVWDLGNTGEAMIQTEKRLASFAGGADNAARTAQYLKQASLGSIDSMTGMTLAAQLLSMEIAKTPQEVGKVAEAAMMLGSPMRDAEDKIKDFTMLLANNSIRRLDQFGISVSAVRARIKELRAENSDMTREEAFQAATMEIAAQKVDQLKDSGVEAATAYQQLTGAFESWKQSIGKDAAGPVASVQRWLANAFNGGATDNGLKSSNSTEQAIAAEKKIVELRAERAKYPENVTGDTQYYLNYLDSQITKLQQIIDLQRQTAGAQTYGQTIGATMGRSDDNSGFDAYQRAALSNMKGDADTVMMYVKTRSKEVVDEIAGMSSEIRLPDKLMKSATFSEATSVLDKKAKELGVTLNDLTRVGGGKWATETAVETLKSAFGLTEDQARKMFSFIQSEAAKGAVMTVDVIYKMGQTGATMPSGRAPTLNPRDELRMDRKEEAKTPTTEAWNAYLDTLQDLRDAEQKTAEENARIAKQAASEFRSQVKAAAGELRGKVESALKGGLDVTMADTTAAKAGLYKDKPMENARRLNAIAEKGHGVLRDREKENWTEILQIPPEILAANDDVLKAWAAKTSEDVQNYLRPDLINWDAFANEFQQQGMDAQTKESTITKGVQVLSDKGLLKGMKFGDAKDKVAEMMGFKPEGTDYSNQIIANLEKGLGTMTPSITIGQAMTTDFMKNANVFVTAGDTAGKMLADAISQALVKNMGAIRTQIAAIIAPEVVKILPKGTGAAK